MISVAAGSRRIRPSFVDALNVKYNLSLSGRTSGVTVAVDERVDVLGAEAARDGVRLARRGSAAEMCG